MRKRRIVVTCECGRKREGKGTCEFIPCRCGRAIRNPEWDGSRYVHPFAGHPGLGSPVR